MIGRVAGSFQRSTDHLLAAYKGSILSGRESGMQLFHLTSVEGLSVEFYLVNMLLSLSLEILFLSLGLFSFLLKKNLTGGRIYF